jgi:hypothetical protein
MDVVLSFMLEVFFLGICREYVGLAGNWPTGFPVLGSRVSGCRPTSRFVGLGGDVIGRVVRYIVDASRRQQGHGARPENAVLRCIVWAWAGQARDEAGAQQEGHRRFELVSGQAEPSFSGGGAQVDRVLPSALGEGLGQRCHTIKQQCCVQRDWPRGKLSSFVDHGGGQGIRQIERSAHLSAAGDAAVRLVFGCDGLVDRGP